MRLLEYLCLGCKLWFTHESLRRRGVEVYCKPACQASHDEAIRAYAEHSRKLKVRLRKRWILIAYGVERTIYLTRVYARKLMRFAKGKKHGRRKRP